MHEYQLRYLPQFHKDLNRKMPRNILQAYILNHPGNRSPEWFFIFKNFSN